MRNFIVKSLGTVVILAAMLVATTPTVFASANVNTVVTQKIDGVVTVTATQNDLYYVVAGKFNRAYRQQLIRLLSDREILNAEFSQTLEMIGVEAELVASNVIDSIDNFSHEMAN